jgi:hypothetical protein
LRLHRDGQFRPQSDGHGEFERQARIGLDEVFECGATLAREFNTAGGEVGLRRRIGTAPGRQPILESLRLREHVSPCRDGRNARRTRLR